MNQIIEINEKNMYAVVEPYVTSAQLQAELFKRGLNTNVKGAGSQCSAMLRGHGHLDQSMGADDRNHLAVEWVTPDGELVRLGSLGSTDEWFCGDGPGPSSEVPGLERRAAELYAGRVHEGRDEALPLAGTGPSTRWPGIRPGTLWPRSRRT